MWTFPRHFCVLFQVSCDFSRSLSVIPRPVQYDSSVSCTSQPTVIILVLCETVGASCSPCLLRHDCVSIVSNCQSSSWWNWCKPLLLSEAYERLASVMMLQTSSLMKSCLKLSPLLALVATRREVFRDCSYKSRSPNILCLCSLPSFIHFHYFSLSVAYFFISYNDLCSFLSSSFHNSFSFHFSSVRSFSHIFM